MVVQGDGAARSGNATDELTREKSAGRGDAEEGDGDKNELGVQMQAQAQRAAVQQPDVSAAITPAPMPMTRQRVRSRSQLRAAFDGLDAPDATRSHRPASIITSPPVAFKPSSSCQNASSRGQTQGAVPSSSSTSPPSSADVAIPASTSSTLSTARSPTPSRRAAFAARELDPLLANLSPMATLEVLKASDAVDRDASSQHRLLAESIAHVSAAERALGIRAAVAGKKLREWFAEVDAWEAEWERGDGFRVPGDGGDVESGYSKAGGRQHRHEASGTGRLRTKVVQEHVRDVEYWGSLPATTVVAHECRLDEIQDEMEALELEELKAYVRKAHLFTRRTGSRTPRSTTAPEGSDENAAGQQPLHRPSSSYTKLDDFTVVITATIMQSLPHLSRLSSLIELWQTRLLVLRRVPRFIHLLDAAQQALHEAQAAIEGERERRFTRQDFYATRDVLRAKNNAMAETLDSMLDILEGRPDSIPDEWIEEVEALEEKRGDWVADAEDAVMNNILGAGGLDGKNDPNSYRVYESIEGSEDGLESIQESAEEDDLASEPSMATDEESTTAARHPGQADTQILPRIDEPSRGDRLSVITLEEHALQQQNDSARSSMTIRPRHEASHARHQSATYSMLTNSPDLTTAETVEYFNVTPQDQPPSYPGLRPLLLDVEGPRLRKESKSRSRSRGRLTVQDAQRLAAESAGRASRSRSQRSEVRSPPTSVRRIEVKRLEYSDADETEEAEEDVRPVSVRRISAIRTSKPDTSAGDESVVADKGDTLESDGEYGLELEPSPDDRPAVETMDFAGAISSHISALNEQTPHSAYSETGDADVEDTGAMTDEAESSARSEIYQPSSSTVSLSASTSAPWPPTAIQAHKPRKSSSDETRQTRSSSGMMPLTGRSRASTLNTYDTWSDHEDSEAEGDTEGGYKSYRRMSQLTVLDEARDVRARRVMQAQVDPSFSYDDVFDSLVQPLSQPGSPDILREAELMRPMTSEGLLGADPAMGFPGFDGVGVGYSPIEQSEDELSHDAELESGQSLQIDYTKRPVIPGVPNLRPSEHSRSKNASLSLRDAGQARADHIKRPSVSGLRNLNLNAEATGNLQRDEVRTKTDPRALAAVDTKRGLSTTPQRPRRHQSEQQVPQRTADSQVPIPKPSNPARHHSQDQITERISTLLSRIPAPIRLYSGSGPDAVEIASSPPTSSAPLAIDIAKANSPLAPTSPLLDNDETPGSPITDPRTPLNSNPPDFGYFPKQAPASSEHQSPALPINKSTIRLTPAPVPASSSSSKFRSAQSQHKLYLLHHPGRSQPIKLYVRLVGEGAGRVMVRVGGGWSDLEEYLKEYVLHHGRSTAVTDPANTGAETNIEVMDVDGPTPKLSHSHQHQRTSPNVAVGGKRSVSRFKELLDDERSVRDESRSRTVSRSQTPVRGAGNDADASGNAKRSGPAAGTGRLHDGQQDPTTSPTAPAALPVHSRDYVSRARRHVSAGAYLQKPTHDSPSPAPPSASSSASASPFPHPDNSPSPMGYSAWISAQGNDPYGRSSSAADSRRSDAQRTDSVGSRARRPSGASLLSLGHARSWNVFRPVTPRATARADEEDAAGLGASSTLGLAGPEGRRGEISPRKKAWVEGVMRQARRVSGGGGGGSGGGDGGTKRVFLRRASLGKGR